MMEYKIDKINIFQSLTLQTIFLCTVYVINLENSNYLFPYISFTVQKKYLFTLKLIFIRPHYALGVIKSTQNNHFIPHKNNDICVSPRSNHDVLRKNKNSTRTHEMEKGETRFHL